MSLNALKADFPLTANRQRWLRVWVSFLLAIGCVCSTGCNRTSSTNPSSGPPELRGGTSSTWWNSSTQTVNVPSTKLLPDGEDFMGERTKLPDAPPPPPTSSNWNWNWNWLNSIDLSSMVWFLGIVLVVVAIGILIYVLRVPAVTLIRKQDRSQDRSMREIVKIADLPFEVQVSDDGFVATAERHAKEGDYNAAVVYLFSFILVELDHHSHVALRRGKTNRMYLRELRSKPDLAHNYRLVMLAFERAFFGKHALSHQDYESCMLAMEAIRSKINASSRQSSPAIQIATSAGLLLVLLFNLGCEKLPTDVYGDQSVSASNSLSSFTAFKSLFDSTGRRTMNARQLTPRMDRFGAIVWTPDTFMPPDAAQCAWIDDWLTRNSGSTFIYVGRDYSPGKDYWEEVAATVEPNRSVPYLNEAAKSASSAFKTFVENAPSATTFSRWFIVEPGSGTPMTVKGTPTENMAYPMTTFEMKVRTRLVPLTDYPPEELRRRFGSDLKKQLQVEVDVRADRLFKDRNEEWDEGTGFWEDSYEDDYSEYGFVPIEPTPVEEEPVAEVDDLPSVDELVEERYAELEESYDGVSMDSSSVPHVSSHSDEVLQDVALEHLSNMKTTPLVVAEDGRPLVYEITDERWARSKLIVINDASLCCNYSLANKERRQAAMGIISRTTEKGRVAFMSESAPLTRYASPESRDPFGLALFLIYPLNVILAHGLLLGIVAMIAMWPIFGRAHRVLDKGMSDFGKHVEAFGQLLMRTKDRRYAEQNVARYFREVKRDTTSIWAQLDHNNSSVEVTHATPPPKTTTK